MNQRPRVFDILKNISGEAADRALIDGLHRVEPDVQTEIIEILLERGHESGLLGLAALFDGLAPTAQTRIVSHTSHFFGALRACIRSSSSQTRQNALKIVRESGNPRLAYLAGHAIHDGSPKVRVEAAATLLALTDEYCRTRTETTGMLREALEHDSSLFRTASQSLQLLCDERRFLTTALGEAMNHYESHHRPEILEASMLMAHEFEGSVFGRNTAQLSTLTRTMLDILGRSLAPRFAPFIYVALGYPELRRKVIPKIADCRDSEFFAEFIRWQWMMRDPKIRKHLVSIRKIAWLQDGFEAIFELPEDAAATMPAWLLPLGLPNAQKVSLLENILILESTQANRAAAWALTEIQTPDGTAALEGLLGHDDEAVQSIVRIELDHRARVGQHLRGKPLRQDRPEAWSRLLDRCGLSEDFGDFWENAEHIHSEHARTAGHYVFKFVSDFETHVRLKLASKHIANRLRAIRLILALHVCDYFQSEIFASANDKSPEIRAVTMNALGYLACETSRRILERALRDISPSVQAAAINSLDQMEVEQRDKLVASKTKSDDPGVRASAVRCLLRMKEPTAAKELIAMLRDTRSDHRSAILRIVDELKLFAIASLVFEISQSDPDRRVAFIAKHVAGRLQRAKADSGKNSEASVLS